MDDSNIIVAHNSRNACNSRNESNNRTAKTLWTPEKAGILAKLVKTACREANYNRDTIKIRDDNRSRDNRNIMYVISIRTARAGSMEVSNSREDSNILQGHQQQKHELTTVKLSNSSRDKRNSRRETRNIKDARNSTCRD
jgi:hypothetical protein